MNPRIVVLFKTIATAGTILGVILWVAAIWVGDVRLWETMGLFLTVGISAWMVLGFNALTGDDD